jgi:hypothetical protein
MNAQAGIDPEKSITTAPTNLRDVSQLQDVDSDKDIAIAMVGEHRHAIDPAIETRVVRKIDLFLIPAMVVGYGLVYYDKVSDLDCLGQSVAVVAGARWELVGGAAFEMDLDIDCAQFFRLNSCYEKTIC